MSDLYKVVPSFESAIANYAGSKYAIAVDTGTMALFLCCRYLQVDVVSIPRRTYVSVPCAIVHAGGVVNFDDRNWSGEYELTPYPIIDSACRFKRGMYQSGTYRCLSFQYKKHLPIGRGGMILCDDNESAEWFRLARFHGRHEVPLSVDIPAFVGWHAYMEPERAARGLSLLQNIGDDPPDLCFEYPDLKSFNIYGNTE